MSTKIFLNIEKIIILKCEKRLLVSLIAFIRPRHFFTSFNKAVRTLTRAQAYDFDLDTRSRSSVRGGSENEKEECLMAKRFFSVSFLCGLIALAVSGALSATQNRRATQGGESEQEGIRVAINHYFKGHATGDPSYMRKAFLPTAHIEGMREGKFTSWTLDEYCALFGGKPASDESARVRTIDFIDVSGNAATAKATLAHGGTVFTDYFVLLKVGEEWRIANKVYYGRKSNSEKR